MPCWLCQSAKFLLYPFKGFTNKHCKHHKFLHIWLSIVFLCTVLHHSYNELEIPKYFCLLINRRKVVISFYDVRVLLAWSSFVYLHLLLTTVYIFVSPLLIKMLQNKIILLGFFRQPHCLLSESVFWNYLPALNLSEHNNSKNSFICTFLGKPYPVPTSQPNFHFLIFILHKAIRPLI